MRSPSSTRGRRASRTTARGRRTTNTPASATNDTALRRNAHPKPMVMTTPMPSTGAIARPTLNDTVFSAIAALVFSSGTSVGTRADRAGSVKVNAVPIASAPVISSGRVSR